MVFDADIPSMMHTPDVMPPFVSLLALKPEAGTRCVAHKYRLWNDHVTTAIAKKPHLSLLSVCFHGASSSGIEMQTAPQLRGVSY